VSIWEADFSQVKLAIDDLKTQGVTDVAWYLAEHSEFVQHAFGLVKIVDVNDAAIKLLGAQTKDELLVSLHKVFSPETEVLFRDELIAIAERRTFFESEAVMRSLQGENLAVLLTIAFPAESEKLESVLLSIMDITERNRIQDAPVGADDGKILWQFQTPSGISGQPVTWE
jgi:PAS domain-containing protein